MLWPYPSAISVKENTDSGISLSLVKQCENSAECEPQFELDTNFLQNDWEFAMAPNAEYCELICRNNPHCNFFSFFTGASDTKSFQCILKKNVTGDVNRVSQPNVISGFPLQKCPSSMICAETIYRNISFEGNNYSIITTSDFQTCQSTCGNDSFCHFYTYGPSKQNNCALKHVMNIPLPEGIAIKNGLTSGFSLSRCGSLRTTTTTSTEESKKSDTSSTYWTTSIIMEVLPTHIDPTSSTIGTPGPTIAASVKIDTSENPDVIFTVYLVDELKTWTEAINYCRCHYTDMVSISSEMLQMVMAELVLKTTGPGVWIGLRNHRMSDTWYWINQLPLNYTKWGEGEPSNPLIHRCGMLGLNGPQDVVWKTACCSMKLRFLCFNSSNIFEKHCISYP
ncbi:coagulation factor XI-like [Protopterus annectens]|uniref:coagulation factor XI-like n=1 Tax=Protopterus annectens TaxID=7888 RepID=UPI001CFAE4DB|nr:coagulation factor XI-like [Protopterus annectens]